ncbi:MAG: CaiB/BaiF CoA transferase family protein [Betaproteobacteria bacterium]|jgi:crotonobetainyl-CoA:carnitine CoA-transferase CaiB-like acyl-CoA transferase|nr:CoA transferase [Rubrivivax sp.]
MIKLPPSTGALQGIRVVDLSRVLAGPYCTQVLADHGADVLKIEPPQGDETRGWGPPFDADGTASYFLGLNRNKVGRTMDFTQEAARAELLALLAEADVLVENFKTGTLEKWGLGWEVLRERFPRLVMCRITGFGADGPMGGLPGYDAAIQALSGIMSVNGEPDERGGQPLRVGLPVVDMVTGLNAALGILLALQERQSSGLGQLVEVALYDCGLSLLHPHAANHLLDGRLPRRSGNAHPNIYPYDTFATATEPIFLAVGNDRQFATLCTLLGDAALAGNEAFASNGKRSVHRVELKQRLEALLAAHECGPLARRLVEAGVPCAPIQDVATALADAHTEHRGMVVGIGESYRGVASPIKLGRTPASYRLEPPGLATAEEKQPQEKRP